MTPHAELDRLAQRIRSSTRDGGLIETAQVQLLGLDAVRAAAGERWPRMREHVREGSLKIISARVGPDDAVIACGDGFLVVFADGSPDEVKPRCKAIEQALLSFYVGEDALAALSPSVRHETCSAAALAGVVKSAGQSAPMHAQHTTLKPGRFWPVWSLRHDRVAAYLCAPPLEPGGDLGYSTAFAAKACHGEQDYLDLDLCLLEQACMAAETPGAAPIGVSVHATTMRRRETRMLYAKHLAVNAAGARHRMFVTIAEIEPGAPLISLSEWCSAIRSTVPRVALDLHYSDRALGGVGSVGAWAAGFHLPPTRGGNLQGALKGLDRWVRLLRPQGVMPLIHGFPSGVMLDLASYSGVAFATGERLWPSCESHSGLASNPVRTGAGDKADHAPTHAPA